MSIEFSYDDKLKSFYILQNFVLDKIEKNEHFFIGRMSGNENTLAGKYMQGDQIDDNFLLQNMLYAAGIQFHNKNEDISRYCQLYNQSVINSQLLGVWDGGMRDQSQQQYKILNNNNCLDKKIICAQSLEPFYYMSEPDYKFQEIFKNKKVLIISSHKKTIEQQLPIIPLIFNNSIFHETSNFYAYKPPQQNAGNHDNNNWEYHFEQMKRDLKHIKSNEFNFDIALVSCGGFGMITCNYIFTELNASSMYIGGGLQLFFGINGSRWVQHPIISRYMNKHWTNVLDIDKPKCVELCENSCYW